MGLGTVLKGKRSCWCKCLCWTTSILILLLIIVGVMYAVFQPKIPTFSVDNINISDLRQPRINARITTYNPNKNIGIYYEEGSLLSVWYRGSNLCQGSLPIFYQGHQNRIVLYVTLTGQSLDGNTLLLALKEGRQTGMIPLDLNFSVPVRIKLGNLKLKKMRIVGTCVLIVDNPSTNAASLIRVQTSECDFKVKPWY